MLKYQLSEKQIEKINNILNDSHGRPWVKIRIEDEKIAISEIREKLVSKK